MKQYQQLITYPLCYNEIRINFLFPSNTPFTLTATISESLAENRWILTGEDYYRRAKKRALVLEPEPTRSLFRRWVFLLISSVSLGLLMLKSQSRRYSKIYSQTFPSGWLTGSILKSRNLNFVNSLPTNRHESTIQRNISISH